MLRLTIGLLMLSAAAAQAEWPMEDGVVVLTDETFDSFIDANPLAMVEFCEPLSFLVAPPPVPRDLLAACSHAHRCTLVRPLQGARTKMGRGG
jgi:hypothetical protein